MRVERDKNTWKWTNQNRTKERLVEELQTQVVQIRLPNFNGGSFGPWKKKALLHLENRELYTCLAPTYNVNHGPYKKKDNAAQEVLSALDDTIAEKVSFCRSAAEIWARLLSVYENQSGNSVCRKLDEYHSLRKSPTYLTT